MKYDVNARMEDVKVYEDGLTAVFKGTAKRTCTCAKCGKEGRPIFSGEERYTACFERQPKGQHYHIDCFAKCGENEVVTGHDNRTLSNCRETHFIAIYAKKWDFGYYASLGFDFRGICFVKEIKNGYAEKVIESAIANGHTVRVNGEKVESADEYRKMTLN